MIIQIKRKGAYYMKMKSQKEVSEIRKRYTPGTFVEMISFGGDPYVTLKEGTKGIVKSVDDIGNIHTSWETGNSLAVVLEEDLIKITLPETKKQVKWLWNSLEDVPMNEETEQIMKPWNKFPQGTYREEIWLWFEETFSNVCVGELMNGSYDIAGSITLKNKENNN